MPKTKLIKELVNNEIGLLQALDRLYLIAHSLNDLDVCHWIKNEKNGYRDSEEPSYRKTRITILGTYQIISSGHIETYQNAPLPTSGIPKENLEQFNNWGVKESLASLIKQKEASDSGKVVGIPLDPSCFIWFENNTNIIMRKAMLHLSPFNLETILDAIKTRVIDILLLYEDNYGPVDDFDINIDDLSEKEKNDIYSASKSIIDGTFNGNTKIVVKGSNLGNGNKIKKQNEAAIYLTTEKKGNFFTRLLKKIFRKH